MRAVNKLERLFGNLLRRQRVEDTLDSELRAYVEELTDGNIAKGMPRDVARRQALVEAGGIEQIKEEVREKWLGQGIHATFQDIRYAFRSLRRSPGFAAVVVGTLSLGIGASLTMFSLMRAVLWRPLPYPEPDRIVRIQVDARNRTDTGATLGEVLDLKERSRSFEQVSMIEDGAANLETGGEMEHVAAARVSDDFLPLLGARPVLGRMLASSVDDGKQQASRVLISGELWRRRFGANPGVIGQVVRINNLDMQIAGVLAAGFRLVDTEPIDIWFPYAMSSTRQYRGIPVRARLKRGVTLGQANAELQTLAAQFEHEFPDYYSGVKGWQASPADRGPGGKLRLTARLLHEEMTSDVRPELFLLAGAVGFVLLMACVNVANLMLARGSARQRELEIRRALGAGKIRIIRQLLTESMVLAAVSAGIGLVCAHFGLAAIGRVSASHIPLYARLEMDAPVALFAVVLSVVTSMLFGLLPAVRLASESGLPLRGGRTATAGGGARRLQRALVVAEVALSIVPLALGGLMLRSFLNLLDAPLGFNPANVVTVKVPFDLKRYPQSDQQWALQRDLLDRVRAIPGVESASAANPLPLADQENRRVGRADQPDTPPILATQQGAIPGYLGVIGTPLLEGRDFTDSDIAAHRDVTIVDERLAKRLWPEGAIGRHLVVYRTGWRHDLEVVGVTGAVRTRRVRDGGTPHYMMPSIEMWLVIRTHLTATQLTPGIKLAVDGARGGRAPFDIRPMSDYVADSIGDTRFTMLVLSAFACASVLLAAVGLYGTLAYLTTQRTREFGIRLALGSSLRAIVAIVMREGVLLAVAGTALGLAGVAAVTGAIRGLLYGVRPLDGVTLFAVAGLVGIVAVTAAGVPAWRATRIDPQTCLRSE